MPWLAAWLLDRAGAPNISHDLMRRVRWQFRWLPMSGEGRTQWVRDTLAAAGPRP